MDYKPKKWNESVLKTAKKKIEKAPLIEKKPCCSVCLDSGFLQELLVFPELPFTGIYVPLEEREESCFSQGLDQGFSFCPRCCHGQLTNVVDPFVVYNQSYTHRGSKSVIATGGNQFFAQFIEKVFPRRTFRGVVDIGCNDGFLLRQLEEKAEHLLGIDPIWGNREVKLTEKIRLLGGFVQEVDIVKSLGKPLDLVISAHTFEHVENPKQVLESIAKKVEVGTVLVIEVPSLDTLLRNHRFDQIFHQHIQYFSCRSISTLMQSIGFSYVAHEFNYSMWGGTMLFAFVRKEQREEKLPDFPKYSLEEIFSSYATFQDSLERLSKKIASLEKGEICAFGAAQMLPVLAYHTPCHLAGISSVYDDNTQRHFLRYPGFSFTIQNPGGVSFRDKTVVITALDSARPLIGRLNSLGAKSILLPLQNL